MRFPHWDGRQYQVLVTTTPFARPNVLVVVDADGVQDTVQLPTGTFYCTDRGEGGRLVMSAASSDIRDAGDVVTVDADGTDLDPLFGIESCNELIGEVDPSGQDLLVFQTCDDPRFSGLTIVHLASGHGVQVVAGPVGVPA